MEKDGSYYLGLAEGISWVVLVDGCSTCCGNGLFSGNGSLLNRFLHSSSPSYIVYGEHLNVGSFPMLKQFCPSLLNTHIKGLVTEIEEFLLAAEIANCEVCSNLKMLG